MRYQTSQEALMDVAGRLVHVVSMRSYLSGSIYGGREDDGLSFCEHAHTDLLCHN